MVAHLPKDKHSATLCKTYVYLVHEQHAVAFNHSSQPFAGIE